MDQNIKMMDNDKSRKVAGGPVLLIFMKHIAKRSFSGEIAFLRGEFIFAASHSNSMSINLFQIALHIPVILLSSLSVFLRPQPLKVLRNL